VTVSTNRSRRFRRLKTELAVVMLGLSIGRFARAASDPHGLLREQNQASAEDADDSPRLSSSELHRMLPALETDDCPPPLLLAPQFGMHIPYQVLGIGLSADLYALPWLRLSALYSFGFSPTHNDVRGSNYAEAAVGVRVFGHQSQTALDLTTRAIAYAAPVTVRAFVPSSHALFVEGGAIAGFFSAAQCTANCDLAGSGEKTLVADERQLILPFAGLRYVYFYQAASQHARFRNRAYLQVYAHAIGRAFNAPDHPIFDWKGDPLDRNPIGGRIGVDLPPPHTCVADLVLHTGCAQGGLALGYSPTPGFVFFEFHISYLVD
jgi:hypothetical protein